MNPTIMTSGRFIQSNNVDLTETSSLALNQQSKLLTEKSSEHHLLTKTSPTLLEQRHRPSGSINMVALDGSEPTTSGCWLGRVEQEASKRSHEEDVYEDLCYVTLRSNYSRSTDSSVSTLIPIEPMQKRDYCIKELVETEKNYCEALGMIIDHFVQPLSKVMHADHHRVIFNNLKSLTDLHSKLYQELFRVCNLSSQLTTTSSQINPFQSAMSAASSMPTLPIHGQHVSSTSPNMSTCSSSSASSQQKASGFTFRLPSFQNLSSSSVMSQAKGSPSPSLETSHLCVTTCTNGRFSNCFLNLRDRFLIYGEYCANLPKAQHLLDQICSQDQLIDQWVTRCQNKANEGRFKLRDLLSLPMQRILKYHLLLGELIRNTTDNHDDYQGLKRAYDVMLDIGAYINEVRRDTETLEIIRDVQRSIVDLSMPENYELKDYGRLIKDGEVKMRLHDDTRMRLKNRYIFIFDKVVLMCKTLRGLQYSYKEAIVLEEYKLEDMPTCSPISKLTKNWSAGWSLVHIRTKQPYTFFVKNEEAKRKWIEAIERAQENVRPKQLCESDHQFAMSNVPVATCCASCYKLLKGTWYQGYVCYVCNIAVHRSCISSVKPCVQVHLSSQSSNLVDSSQSDNPTFKLNWSNTNKLNINDANRSSTWTPDSPFKSHSIVFNPPTPSRTKRMLAKTNVANVVQGQLAFEQNDTIIVYANHGSSCYGRNLRTGDQGFFSSCLVTELVTESPSASSSIDSPTCSTALRFCYDNQLANGGDISSSTLPRKFPIDSSNSKNPSPQSVLISASPLAASTPALPIESNSDIFFATSKPVMEPQQSKSECTSGQMANPALVEDGNLRLFFGNGYNLEEYAWFAGPMDRETAQTTLNPLPNGSFLVRISPKQKNSYAISINYKGQVKHMRVQVTYTIGISPTTIKHQHHHSPSHTNLEWIGPDKPTHFYLSERRYFRTIVDLVRWYELNSLSESFNMVNTQLLLPYKKAYCHEVLGHAIALYAFTGTSSAASSFLSLRKGDRVTVLSRAAEDKGWWKGQIGDRIGYFPFKYVTPTTNSLKIWFDLQANHDSNMPSQTNLVYTCTSRSNENDHQMNSVNDFFSTVNTSTQINDVVSVQEQSPSSAKMSSSSISNSSSTSTSSATTLSSPVNSDTQSIHSRQASSDAGIDIAGFIGDNLANATSNQAVNINEHLQGSLSM